MTHSGSLGPLTREECEFLLAVEEAPSDATVWQKYKERVPEASHDDFSSLWGWAQRMGYCLVQASAKTYHVVLKGQKALKRSMPCA